LSKLPQDTSSSPPGRYRAERLQRAPNSIKTKLTKICLPRPLRLPAPAVVGSSNTQGGGSGECVPEPPLRVGRWRPGGGGGARAVLRRGPGRCGDSVARSPRKVVGMQGRIWVPNSPGYSPSRVSFCAETSRPRRSRSRPTEPR
jgi:hypothetical protein